MQNSQKVSPANGAGASHVPMRKSFLLVASLICLACAAAVFVYLKTRRPEARPTLAAVPQTQNSSAEEQPTAVEVTAQPSQLPSTGLAETKASTAVPVTVPPTKAATPTTEPIVPRPEPTPYTRQLVGSLSQILTNGPLTPESAEAWKQALSQLTQQGAAAVPAISEFLEKNLDINFGSAGGANLLGQSSLRLALLNALQNIGGPEALALSTQTLQNTADPREIALLARSLEQQAPEQYRQMAVEAARAALQMAAAGKLDGRDVGPLFNILEQYGGANALADLQNAAGQWRYYAAIALADLPDAAGVPSLLQMLQDPNTGVKSTKSVALQVLAQWATQSPDVRDALLDQARLNQLPNSTWVNVAAVLAGDKYQIGDLAGEGIAPMSGERRWHLSAGNQTFYSRPDTANWSSDEFNQRMTLIDQLLAANLDAAARDALQKARASLLSKRPP